MGNMPIVSGPLHVQLRTLLSTAASNSRSDPRPGIAAVIRFMNQHDAQMPAIVAADTGDHRSLLYLAADALLFLDVFHLRGQAAPSTAESNTLEQHDDVMIRMWRYGARRRGVVTEKVWLQRFKAYPFVPGHNDDSCERLLIHMQDAGVVVEPRDGSALLPVLAEAGYTRSITRVVEHLSPGVRDADVARAEEFDWTPPALHAAAARLRPDTCASLLRLGWPLDLRCAVSDLTPLGAVLGGGCSAYGGQVADRELAVCDTLAGLLQSVSDVSPLLRTALQRPAVIFSALAVSTPASVRITMAVGAAVGLYPQVYRESLLDHHRTTAVLCVAHLVPPTGVYMDTHVAADTGRILYIPDPLRAACDTAMALRFAVAADTCATAARIVREHDDYAFLRQPILTMATALRGGGDDDENALAEALRMQVGTVAGSGCSGVSPLLRDWAWGRRVHALHLRATVLRQPVFIAPVHVVESNARNRCGAATAAATTAAVAFTPPTQAFKYVPLPVAVAVIVAALAIVIALYRLLLHGGVSTS